MLITPGFSGRVTETRLIRLIRSEMCRERLGTFHQTHTNSHQHVEEQKLIEVKVQPTGWAGDIYRNDVSAGQLNWVGLQTTAMLMTLNSELLFILGDPSRCQALVISLDNSQISTSATEHNLGVTIDIQPSFSLFTSKQTHSSL